MSLDVYLKQDISGAVKEWEAKKAKSLSATGSMIDLIPIIEEYYNDRKPDNEEVLYSNNITHNLGEMANSVGIYEYLWRPDEKGAYQAHDLIRPLQLGLKELKKDPEKYKKFNPANGWGKYENLLSFTQSYLAACIENPDAIIEISR